VDSMRGRSSTWTRIRVNLRHVPESERPLQETPDPDDDPTREWRARRPAKKT
jgi:bifunctional non-homologous end joining protein LigD